MANLKDRDALEHSREPRLAGHGLTFCSTALSDPEAVPPRLTRLLRKPLSQTRFPIPDSRTMLKGTGRSESGRSQDPKIGQRCTGRPWPRESPDCADRPATTSPRCSDRYPFRRQVAIAGRPDLCLGRNKPSDRDVERFETMLCDGANVGISRDGARLADGGSVEDGSARRRRTCWRRCPRRRTKMCRLKCGNAGPASRIAHPEAGAFENPDP
ncbi:hypothetical protein C8J36_10680 [Rhizobium sp. PP-F2F-G48]|nr:hypothetical protein C8J36_10680 [Rhizobium sp. PP-F2F-G48]